jgi:hypothetical protein
MGRGRRGKGRYFLVQFASEGLKKKDKRQKTKETRSGNKCKTKEKLLNWFLT